MFPEIIRGAFETLRAIVEKTYRKITLPAKQTAQLARLVVVIETDIAPRDECFDADRAAVFLLFDFGLPLIFRDTETPFPASTATVILALGAIPHISGAVSRTQALDAGRTKPTARIFVAPKLCHCLRGFAGAACFHPCTCSALASSCICSAFSNCRDSGSMAGASTSAIAEIIACTKPTSHSDGSRIWPVYVRMPPA